MADTMTAWSKVRPEAGGTEFIQAPIPEPKADEVRLRIKATSFCGTDLHIYRWDAWAQGRIHVPLIQGHEYAGEVDKVGSDIDFLEEGDYVTAENHLTCGHCFQCQNGQRHLCRRVRIIGIDLEGSFAEYLTIPAKTIWKLDADLPLRIASILDPLGNAVQTVIDADVPGKDIAIFGLGPIGLMAVALCRKLGASRVYAVDISDDKLELGKQMGAHVVYHSSHDVVEDILARTNGKGADEVLELSGSNAALSLGIEVVRAGGGVHILGIYPQPVTIEMTRDVVFKGVNLHGINGRRIWETWWKMRGILRTGLDLDPIITGEFPFSKAPEALAQMDRGVPGKVIMYLD